MEEGSWLRDAALDPIYLGIDLTAWNDSIGDGHTSPDQIFSAFFPCTPSTSAIADPLEQLCIPDVLKQISPDVRPQSPPPSAGTNPSLATCESKVSSPNVLLKIAPKLHPDNPPFRRGPGRPKKKDSKSQAMKAMKKQNHNLSASQSRRRLNSVINELWNLLPDSERSSKRGRKQHKVTRTEKIEEVILYVNYLQEEL